MVLQFPPASLLCLVQIRQPPCPLHPAALLLTLDKPISPMCQLCQSQIGVCACPRQPSEVFRKSNGFEHLVTCASSAHPSLIIDGCTQRLVTWMTAVLTPPQALQLGSGKDTLICCTVIIHTTVVLSIARQGSGWFFKGVEEGIKAPALFFCEKKIHKQGGTVGGGK